MASSSSSPITRPDPIPRARPVIELNLNVEDAMIEAVDLLRTIRVQLEAITGTVNDRLNRTFSDVSLIKNNLNYRKFSIKSQWVYVSKPQKG